MDKNQLDGLLAFKLIAEKQNFTAAAEELGISPPAISKMIKQLERRSGVALLNRTTRSTSLTEAGERFMSQVGPALDQISSAFLEVSTYSKKPSGVLRLNVPKLIYPSYLEPVITSFIKKYPEISVDIVLEDAASDVVEGGFDAGIRVSDILAKDMVAIKLFGPVEYVIAGSPKYFKETGKPKHPKELLEHNCIRVRIEDGVYDRWEFEQKGKAFEVQVKGSLIFNDGNLAVKSAIDGLGICYVNRDAIEREIELGKLEVVLPTFAPSSAGFYLYYPERSQIQPKLRVFIEHLKTVRLKGQTL